MPSAPSPSTITHIHFIDLLPRTDVSRLGPIPGDRGALSGQPAARMRAVFGQARLNGKAGRVAPHHAFAGQRLYDAAFHLSLYPQGRI
ncbi:hypothetical protein LF63_0112565 [Oleiagrimonas soli]|uniref:Uncharacterized protein n=1 Tax=Oleiagrimonas soli TaxID=1543381 RepID=A0A099CTJ2_9GAMM|nr:hypothetical protein LF63_0112565 [Oleiagrimonas soli]